jgi:predicted component of type VI protein secretion system
MGEGDAGPEALALINGVEEPMWMLESNTGEGEEVIRFRMRSGQTKTVGRATRADFVLEATLVSRIHCRLTVSPSGDLVVDDLSSTNGTFVNGHRVTRQPLNPGDRLSVGRLDFVVTRDGAVGLDEGEEAASAASAAAAPAVEELEQTAEIVTKRRRQN